MTDRSKVSNGIRWVARVLGSVIVAFILFFLLAPIFGEDESGKGFQSSQEVIMFLFFPISTLLGLSLAFKWEGLGGITTIAGMIGLYAMRPDLLQSPFMMIPIVPGILYTIYWLMTKNAVELPTQ